MRRSSCVFVFIVALLGISFVTPVNISAQTVRTRVRNPDLGRGVSFGNMLEAPFEGAWGLSVEEEFFDRVKEVGLEHIRLPVSWTFHADANFPYVIDETFFQRVDWCLDQATQRGLKIIINVHHYDELNADPVAETPRALAIWRQIAERYADRGSRVYFEILNEPHGEFSANPALWNTYVAQALSVIRESNPTRFVLVGTVFWNGIDSLDDFVLPNDSRLMTTVHYYSPFEFTHQGAEWIDPILPVGVEWYPNYKSMDSDWQNWSWGTTVESGPGGLTVSYNEPWAAFYAHSDNGVSGATHLVFSADKAMNLRISVSNDNGQGGEIVMQTNAGEQNYVLNLADFGNPDPVTDVFIQNNQPVAGETWFNQRFYFRTNGPAEHVVNTQAATINKKIQQAVDWGLAHNVRMHLGEFGAYEAADMPSRVRWTASVRQAMENGQMAWSYWELAAGFGFYDPVAQEFRHDLTNALVPGYDDP